MYGTRQIEGRLFLMYELVNKSFLAGQLTVEWSLSKRQSTSGYGKGKPVRNQVVIDCFVYPELYFIQIDMRPLVIAKAAKFICTKFIFVNPFILYIVREAIYCTF